MKRYRSIQLKYLPLTDKSSSRLSIRDTWHGKHFIIEWNDRFSTTFDNAIDYFKQLDIEVSAITSTQQNHIDVLLIEDFEVDILKKHQEYRKWKNTIISILLS